MDSIAEIKKSDKIAKVEHCMDRISELPNDVASLILSYLDIQQVVRTSVLSTRWKSCWTHITTLDLDDKFPDHSEERKEIMRAGFMNFVHRVLASVRCLHKLRIRIRTEDYDHIPLVNAWIALVARHEIRELDIKIALGSSMINLPQDLFRCSELVVLKLERNFAVDIPVSVSLSKLKTLYLFEVRMIDGDSIDRLLSGCPILEELKMEVCLGAKVRVVNISSPSLKKLSLIHLCYDDYGELERVVLDTPGLQYLVIDDFVVKAYSLNKLYQIIDASVYIQTLSDAVTGLFDGLSNAHSIDLIYQRFFEATGLYNHQFPKYHSLTYLDIRTRFMNWTLLSKLLENSPYLETLVMGFEFLEDLPGEDDAWGVPHCLQFHLKFIKIRTSSGGDATDDVLVNYFRQEGKVLNELTVISLPL